MKKIFGLISILGFVLLLLLVFHWRLCNKPSPDSKAVNENTSTSPILEKLDEVENAEERVIDAQDENYKEIEDDADKDPIDIYIAESKRIREIFIARREQLNKEAFIEIEDQKVPDYELWEKKFYQSLFKEVKSAMKRVFGTDDFLTSWENGTAVQIVLKVRELSSDDYENICIPYKMDEKYLPVRPLPLLMIYSLATIYENRSVILKDTFYEDSYEGDLYRIKYFNLSSKLFNSIDWSENTILNGFARIEKTTPLKDLSIRPMFFRMDIWNIFPPRFHIRTTFDDSWFLMAIYSFKNERARKILYELATNNNNDRFLSSLARFATFYLPLFYDSSDLIPSLNTRLETYFEQFYNQCPRSLKDQFDGKDVKDLTSGEFNNILEEFKKKNPSLSYDVVYSSSYHYANRLLTLRDSLLFNEKIPPSERERFDIVRRELAISWALAPKDMALAPRPQVILKKGEEHFVEYLREYYVPSQTPIKYHFEEGE